MRFKHLDTSDDWLLDGGVLCHYCFDPPYASHVPKTSDRVIDQYGAVEAAFYAGGIATQLRRDAGLFRSLIIYVQGGLCLCGSVV
jgi:hypothetical protein